jgi:E3 ubiquitin-protein ligase TRIP12
MVVLLLFSYSQVYEVLKLLYELLPTSARDPDAQQVSDKESFLVNSPSLLQKFGMDVLPLLIQVGFLVYSS